MPVQVPVAGDIALKLPLVSTARRYLAADYTPSAAFAQVTLDTVVAGYRDLVPGNAASGAITVDKNGAYLAGVAMWCKPAATGGVRSAILLVNGAGARTFSNNAGDNQQARISGADVLYLNANDVVTLQHYFEGTTPPIGGGINNTGFSLTFLGATS